MFENVYTNKDGYHGIIHYNFKEYWVDETHDLSEISGKWGISVQVPGVIHKPQIFTISVHGYDNEPDNPDLNNKRPALFYSENDAKAWADDMKFPEGTLRVVEIKPEVSFHKLFNDMGAYLVKRSIIVMPKKQISIEDAFKEKEEREKKMKKFKDGGMFH